MTDEVSVGPAGGGLHRKDLTGTDLGRYRVVAKLGEGGMGEVYRAEDTVLRRAVALKRLAAHLAADQSHKHRLLREARSASALSHPNIAALFDVFEADGETLLVMELVAGESLRARLARPLGLADCLAILRQCAEALDAAHRAGIVHRDIKPENILLAAEGRVKILDFGIAQRLPGDDTETATSETVGLRGTPRYSAPEVLQAREPDARADIFSLGVVAYEMLTGGHPFEAGTAPGVMARILTEAPPPPSQHNRALPAEVDRVVGKMLARDPAARYATARDLLADLRPLEQAAPVPAPAKGVSMRTSALLAAALLIAVLATAAYFFQQHSWRPARPSPETIMLVVLPFENLSGDPGKGYLSDGLTEEMINQLGRLQPQRLRVIARTSAMQYKGSEKRVDQIGRQLRVDYILEGSMRSEGDRLRVNARLVRVSDQTSLWTESYERNLAGVLALQTEVAGRIARSLALELLPAQQAALARVPTTNSAAYDAYLKGNRLNRGTYAQRRKAKEYYEQAVRIDPEYAPGYAGLADYYWATTEVSPSVAMPKAREYALKALALDDTLAHAHTALAAIKWYADWDWGGAEKEFKRALEVNTSDVEAHRLYSAFLSSLGRFEEAVAEIGMAQELDPLSLLTSTTACWTFYTARQYDRATQQCQRTLELDPNYYSAHAFLCDIYLAKGMYRQAIAEGERAIGLSEPDPVRAVGLARAYALAGKREKARGVLAELRQLSRRSYVPPYYLAVVHVALGEVEQAFSWLEKAYGDRDRYLVWLKADQAVDPLRSDVRFHELLHRVGLPP